MGTHPGELRAEYCLSSRLLGHHRVLVYCLAWT
jgi:hypothetical protein